GVPLHANPPLGESGSKQLDSRAVSLPDQFAIRGRSGDIEELPQRNLLVAALDEGASHLGGRLGPDVLQPDRIHFQRNGRRRSNCKSEWHLRKFPRVSRLVLGAGESWT